MAINRAAMPSGGVHAARYLLAESMDLLMADTVGHDSICRCPTCETIAQLHETIKLANKIPVEDAGKMESAV